MVNKNQREEISQSAPRRKARFQSGLSPSLPQFPSPALSPVSGRVSRIRWKFVKAMGSREVANAAVAYYKLQQLRSAGFLQ